MNETSTYDAKLTTVRQFSHSLTKDKAVVYVFQGYGDIGAEGSWYYLERKDGKWSFIKKSVFMMA